MELNNLYNTSTSLGVYARNATKVPTMKSLDGVNKKNDVKKSASEAPQKNVEAEPEKIDFSNVRLSQSLRKWLISIHLRSLISEQLRF